jgi:hypothetical protein
VGYSHGIPHRIWICGSSQRSAIGAGTGGFARKPSRGEEWPALSTSKLENHCANAGDFCMVLERYFSISNSANSFFLNAGSSPFWFAAAGSCAGTSFLS